MKSEAEILATELWGDFLSQIPKGTFASAAFYFADAGKAGGQTPQERFFEVWQGMLSLGAVAPTNTCRRELKKFLAAQGRSKEEIKAILEPLKMPQTEEGKAAVEAPEAAVEGSADEAS